jgi:hypothetical protein
VVKQLFQIAGREPNYQDNTMFLKILQTNIDGLPLFLPLKVYAAQYSPGSQTVGMLLCLKSKRVKTLSKFSPRKVLPLQSALSDHFGNYI